MATLYDIVLHKKQELSGITANPTLEAIDLDFCKQLDALVSTNTFVHDRVEKTIKELSLAGGVDYNDHYKNAYDNYNEAICYLVLQQRGFKPKNIPEGASATPDFEVEFSFKNWKSEIETDKTFVEVKSLAFADGNLQYRKVQNAALECNIRMEEQRKRGRRFCSGEYEVSPLGNKDKGIASEIEILIKKIDQNIKPDQYKYGNGQDTVLLVDLGQYLFPFKEHDCLPVAPDIHRKGSWSGRLWMTAFGHQNERVFTCGEFEGKGCFDNELQQQGILEKYPFIKRLLFISGTKPEEKKIFGFYRYDEQDRNTIVFVHQASDYVNDDRNSFGFKYYDMIQQEMSDCAFKKALQCLGVAKGDEVMVQTMAPISMVEAVLSIGAVPVFVDSEPQTGNMCAEQLRNAIRSRFAETGKMPKAVVPVSMFGKLFNKEYIAKIADRYEIPVVEYPAPAGNEVPMPLHLREEYKNCKAFVNGVAEKMWKSA